MAEDTYDDEEVSTTPPPSSTSEAEIADKQRLLAYKLVSGEVRPEDIPGNREAALFYLEELLASSVGAQRDAILNLMTRLRDMPEDIIAKANESGELERFI